LAERYERGEDISDEELSPLFNYGSSMGGAHPKVTISDGKRHYLAKFNSIKDRYNTVLLEATCLSLAKDCGLDVPYFYVETLAGNKQALMIERFDITQYGRNHVVSFKTLLDKDRYSHFYYSDLAETLGAVTYKNADLRSLFTQMVFNAAIGNKDDHENNFSVIRNEQGYCLSPVYDIVPNIEGAIEHKIFFQYSALSPRRNELISIAPSFRLTHGDAAMIINNVVQCVKAGWLKRCKEYRVDDNEAIHFSKDIERNLSKLAGADVVCGQSCDSLTF